MQRYIVYLISLIGDIITGAIVFVGIGSLLERMFGIKVPSARWTDSEPFPHTRLPVGFSDSGSARLHISGAKTPDMGVCIYAQYLPDTHAGNMLSSPKIRFFTAFDRKEEFEIAIPWRMHNTISRWNCSKLAVHIGNDTTFSRQDRTPDNIHLASKCLELLFDAEAGPGGPASPGTFDTLPWTITLDCYEWVCGGRVSLICPYREKEGPVLRLAESAREKDARLYLHISVQGYFDTDRGEPVPADLARWLDGMRMESRPL